MLSPDRRRLRGRVAALSQTRPEDHPDLVAARAELRAAKAEDYISRLVAEAPPLSDAQRARLAALLLPVGGAA
jgi:hypothetical protein